MHFLGGDIDDEEFEGERKGYLNVPEARPEERRLVHSRLSTSIARELQSA
jgi:hypothetical protein